MMTTQLTFMKIINFTDVPMDINIHLDVHQVQSTLETVFVTMVHQVQLMVELR